MPLRFGKGANPNRCDITSYLSNVLLYLDMVKTSLMIFVVAVSALYLPTAWSTTLEKDSVNSLSFDIVPPAPVPKPSKCKYNTSTACLGDPCCNWCICSNVTLFECYDSIDFILLGLSDEVREKFNRNISLRRCGLYFNTSIGFCLALIPGLHLSYKPN